jgi:hypothetical protein
MPGCRIATWNSEQLLADKYLGYFDGIGFDRAERVLIYSGIHHIFGHTSGTEIG